MNKKELNKIILDNVLVKKEEKDNFYLIDKNGEWIFDFRKAFLKGKLLEKFCIYFWDKYEKDFPFQVGGLEIGSIPFISGILYEGLKRGYDLSTFIVRKERKPSGLGNKIEGILTNDKIIIVDDLINSGKSLNIVNKSLNNEGKKIYKVFVFIHFGNPNLNKNKEINNLVIDYEFTLGDFGLQDFFENTAFNFPIIFPKNKKIYSLKNPNKFLDVPKTNPLKIGKNIFFGGEGGIFVGICENTGNIFLNYEINKTRGHKNILSSPIYHKDNILFGGYDGNLHCLNVNTGKNKWTFCEGADFIGSSPDFSEKNNSVYVGLEHSSIKNKGSLVSIDFDTGRLLWQFPFDDFVHCSPAYNEKYGLVYCGSNDGKLICVRSDNGKLIFERNFGASIKGGFAFSNDGKYIYFGCFDKKFYCLDALLGKIIFSYETQDIIYTKPLIIGKNVFFGGLDKNFYHLDINGKLINKIETSGKIFAQATFIKDNIIVFGSNDSYIYFYDYKLCKILFVIEHFERISTKIIFDEEFTCIYVLDFLNNLYKYSIKGFI